MKVYPVIKSFGADGTNYRPGDEIRESDIHPGAWQSVTRLNVLGTPEEVPDEQPAAQKDVPEVQGEHATPAPVDGKSQPAVQKGSK